MVRAGFAFTLISLPKASRVPALVAGFTRVLMRQRPGTEKTPQRFTSLVPRVVMLLMNSETCFCFKECSPASCFAMAPLVIALVAAFMVFMVLMGGSISAERVLLRVRPPEAEL